LPSGLKWATYNVGASKPTEYGAYFAWAETATKNSYELDSYKWNVGNRDQLLKYKRTNVFGNPDYKTVIAAEDDAAAVNWKNSWRMPTREEVQELLDACTWENVTDYMGSGVNGWIGTSKSNGKTIFLPAAGLMNGTFSNYKGSKIYYWTSTLSYSAYDAYADYRGDCLDVVNNNIKIDSSYREFGFSVRAVSE